MMNSGDCLSTIGSFLRLCSLKSFTQLNRRARFSSDRASVWRHAVLAEFSGDFRAFSQTWGEAADYSVDWKRLGLRGIAAQRSWAGVDASLGLGGQMETEVWRVLIEPDLPSLPLRRSVDAVESFYMELLEESVRNTLDTGRTLGEMGERVRTAIDLCAEDLYREVADWRGFQACLQGRAVASQARIVQIYSAISTTVQFHCRATAAIISEADSPASMLTAYIARWGGYCSSIQALTSLCQPLLDLMTEMVDARVTVDSFDFHRSILAFMTDFWSEFVYKPLKTRLESAACAVLSDVLQSSAGVIDDRVETLRGFVRDLMDISTEATKCHFAGHSLYQPTGPYADLETNMVGIIESHYVHAHSDPIRMRNAIETGSRTLEFIFYPCTVVKLETLLLTQEYECARRYFLQRIQQCSSGAIGSLTAEAVAFAGFLKVSPANMAELGAIEGYIQAADCATRRYIEGVVSPGKASEYLPDLVLELRKSRIGLSFGEEVVY